MVGAVSKPTLVVSVGDNFHERRLHDASLSTSIRLSINEYTPPNQRAYAVTGAESVRKSCVRDVFDAMGAVQPACTRLDLSPL